MIAALQHLMWQPAGGHAGVSLRLPQWLVVVTDEVVIGICRRGILLS